MSDGTSQSVRRPGDQRSFRVRYEIGRRLKKIWELIRVTARRPVGEYRGDGDNVWRKRSEEEEY